MAASTFEAPLVTNRPLLAASVAVFRNGKVLVAQRARGLSTGLWSLPGGRVEIGETLAECAIREVQEETGVAAKDPVFVDHVEMIGEDHHAVICAFAAHWVSGEGETGPEAAGILWCDPAEIERLPTTPRLAEVIAKARLAIETR